MSPPTSPTKARRASHDTGFPDPFPGTSLPHPDADLSPNATISHDDSALGMALKRRRHTLLRKRRRNVSNHGYITPQTEAIHSILSLGLINMESNQEGEGANLVASPTDSSIRFSKEDEEDAERTRRDSWKRGDEDTPPTSPDTAYSDYAESKKRHSFLGRLLRR